VQAFCIHDYDITRKIYGLYISIFKNNIRNFFYSKIIVSKHIFKSKNIFRTQKHILKSEKCFYNRCFKSYSRIQIHISETLVPRFFFLYSKMMIAEDSKILFEIIIQKFKKKIEISVLYFRKCL